MNIAVDECVALCMYDGDDAGEVLFGDTYQSCNDVAVALGRLHKTGDAEAAGNR